MAGFDIGKPCAVETIDIVMSDVTEHVTQPLIHPLRERALLEASQGKIGNTVDRVILYCYHYDPDAKGYVVFAGNVMRLGGAITLVAMLIFLGGLWLWERHRHKAKLSN